MIKQTSEPFHEELTNSAYLDLVLNKFDQVPEYVLLPHEQAAVHEAYQRKVISFQKIIEEKESVTGGDDWHDGAFRATDNEAKIITGSMAAIAPFLGAPIVEYPDTDEPKVTLGSRVNVKQGRVSFLVDIVGFRAAYPNNVIDEDTGEEVMAVSPDSPIGAAILGKLVGEEASYVGGNSTLKAVIETLSQVAVREYFKDSSKLATEIKA